MGDKYYKQWVGVRVCKRKETKLKENERDREKHDTHKIKTQSICANISFECSKCEFIGSQRCF